MTIRVLYNGNIHTLDPQHPTAQAIAIRDGRVLAVGSEAHVREAAGSGAESIDLGGRTVVPGLCDAHVHITWQGLASQSVHLGEVTSIDEALRQIAARAAALPAGAWVRGGRWDHSMWGNQWPTAAQLDAIVPDRPVFLSRKDGHSAWVNTLALKLAGVTDDTPDPHGGQVQRDEHGRATGILLETAQELVRRVMPEATNAERHQGLRDAFREALSYGITSIHVPPGGEASDGRITLSDLQLLRERGELSVRCLAHIARTDLDSALALGLHSGLGDEWLRIGGLKIFADGTLGSETADMLAPFEGRDHTGLPTLTVEELNSTVSRAIAGGISVLVHAIGDGANRKVLNAVELAYKGLADQGREVKLALPNRIEHAQILDPADIPRFAELGVIASMQPIHATGDMLVADRLWGARCAGAYAWCSLLNAGATLAFGSDAPVESMNPWWGIHAAVTRQARDNTPAGGWYPEQRLNVQQSLEAYCLGPAIASGETNDKGALQTGMLADLAVLSADPFTCAPEELHMIVSELTIVEGKIVWEA